MFNQGYYYNDTRLPFPFHHQVPFESAFPSLAAQPDQCAAETATARSRKEKEPDGRKQKKKILLSYTESTRKITIEGLVFARVV